MKNDCKNSIGYNACNVSPCSVFLYNKALSEQKLTDTISNPTIVE